MGKILFWFIVIVAVLVGARLLARAANSEKPAGRLPKGATPGTDMSNAETMVRCEHCGIHMPRSQAFLSDGHTWCGQEHARLGQRDT